MRCSVHEMKLRRVNSCGQRPKELSQDNASSLRASCRSLRAGITLLEVLVSVAIFLGALTTIMQLLSLGKRAEMMTRLQTEAVMRCEAKMAEVVSGAQELTSVDNEVFPDSEGSGMWQWRLTSMNSSAGGLLQVTVRVRYVVGDDDEMTSFELNRFMRDPQLFIDAALSTSEVSE